MMQETFLPFVNALKTNMNHFLQGREKSVCIIRLNIGKSSKMISFTTFEVSNSFGGGCVISKKSKTQTIVTKFCPSKLSLEANSNKDYRLPIISSTLAYSFAGRYTTKVFTCLSHPNSDLNTILIF